MRVNLAILGTNISELPMSTDRCPTHDVSFDSDYLAECPACTEDAEEETVSEPSIVRLEMSEAELEKYRNAALWAIAFMKQKGEQLSPYALESYRQDLADTIETLSKFRKVTHYPEYVS